MRVGTLRQAEVPRKHFTDRVRSAPGRPAHAVAAGPATRDDPRVGSPGTEVGAEGLPLAAVLAWAFEIAGDRIQRTAALDKASAVIGPPASVQAPAPSASGSATAVAVTRSDSARRSIAVLPFANLTGDAGKDFLGEGLAGHGRFFG